MKILISAAETSSDAHGAQLLRTLKARYEGQVDAFGIGGPQLQAEGLRTVIDARDLLVMGFHEILGRLPRIFGALKVLSEAAAREKPDVVVVIDYPDFHFRLARQLKALNIPVIYYIPPKVWAWRKGRIRFLKKYFTQILSIFPFEENFYRNEGIAVKYIGNPLVDGLPLDLTKVEARQRLGLGSESVLLVMPGSRPAELKQHFDLMLDSALLTAQDLEKRRFLSSGKKLQLLLPSPLTTSLEEVRLKLNRWLELKKTLGIDPEKLLQIRISQNDSHICMVAADVGMVKSGTSTLEAGVLGCPHAVIYKPGRITSWIYQNLIRYRGPVGLVNLVAGGLGQKKEQFLLREILLNEATSEAIAQETVSLFLDSVKKTRIKQGLLKLRAQVLGVTEGGSALKPSQAAAEEVFLCIEKNRSRLQSKSELGSSVSLFSGFSGISKWLVSAIWSTLSQGMRWGVRSGLIQTVRLESRVISVGNIQAGGTGKTPLVAQIAREANERGLVAAILTRGYRSVWEISGGVICPKADVNTQLCGDEAALLHDMAPDAYIGVGADRVKQFYEVSRVLGRHPDLVILDDGFQNWKIRKDVEIVAITSLNRTQAYFRDWNRALLNADLLIWTKGEIKPKDYQKPLVPVRFRISQENHSARLSAPMIVLVTGIADPESARQAITRIGYRIAKHFSFSDHFQYHRPLVEEILSSLEGKNLKLAMTGKDWVKWREFGVSREQVLVFEPDLIFEEGKEIWDRILWK